MEVNSRYFLTDYESGQLYEVSKEYHDSFLETMKMFFKTKLSVHLDLKAYGKPVVFGTAGDLSGGSADLCKMFYEPESFRLLTLDEAFKPLRPEETKEDNL